MNSTDETQILAEATDTILQRYRRVVKANAALRLEIEQLRRDNEDHIRESWIFLGAIVVLITALVVSLALQ